MFTKKSQMTSPPAKLPREISSRDIFTHVFKRNFYQTKFEEQFWQKILEGEKYLPMKLKRLIYQKMSQCKKAYTKKKRKTLSPQNIWRWVPTQKVPPKETQEKFLQQIFASKNPPKKIRRKVSTKKSWKIIQKCPWENSLPKNLKRNLSKSSWSAILPYNYQAPVSSEEWVRLWPQWEAAVLSCFQLQMLLFPVITWSRNRTYLEKASTPPQVPDDEEPDLQVDEETSKLHEQFMSYQQDQEEELKHYRQYLEKKETMRWTPKK